MIVIYFKTIVCSVFLALWIDISLPLMVKTSRKHSRRYLSDDSEFWMIILTVIFDAIFEFYSMSD